MNRTDNEPSFGAAPSLSALENSLPGTQVGTLAATDPDSGATLTFGLIGADAASFQIDNTGQITVAEGANLDFEAKSSYTFTATVSDGLDAGGVSDISYGNNDVFVDATITLTDGLDPPGKPDPPTFTPNWDQVLVRWNAPVNTNNGPPITDYDVRYRWLGWVDQPVTGTTPSATITGLRPGYRYEVQVRADNTGVITMPECVTYLGTLTAGAGFERGDGRSTWIESCKVLQSADPHTRVPARYFTFQVDSDINVTFTHETYTKLVLLQGDHNSTTQLATSGPQGSATHLTHNLTANTAYTVYVRDRCGSSDPVNPTCGLLQSFYLKIRPEIVFLEDPDGPGTNGKFVISRTVDESLPGGTKLGAPLTTNERGNPLHAYQVLPGSDGQWFLIDEVTGQLTTKTALDADNPRDANGDNVYEFTASYTDNIRPSSPKIAATMTITVNNLQEVTLSSSDAYVGISLTARLADPLKWVDQDVAPTWQWQSSSDGGSTWSDIAGETGDSYTPVAGDLGNRLRAAVAASTNAVPSFSAGDSTTLSVAENIATVGTLTVTDSDDTVFEFSLTGDDAALFSIDNNGQIITVGSAGFDHESSRPYSVTAHVTDKKDPAGIADTVIDDAINVTINITDDNAEAPGKPDAPDLGPGVTQITVLWDPPTNPTPTALA